MEILPILLYLGYLDYKNHSIDAPVALMSIALLLSTYYFTGVGLYFPMISLIILGIVVAAKGFAILDGVIIALVFLQFNEIQALILWIVMLIYLGIKLGLTAKKNYSVLDGLALGYIIMLGFTGITP